MVGNNNWGTINSSGASSHLTVRFAELAHGGISLSSGASGLIEDSYLHDYGSEIVGTPPADHYAAHPRKQLLRNHLQLRDSGLAEDSLFENILIASGDAFEIQNGIPARLSAGAPSGTASRATPMRWILMARQEYSCTIVSFTISTTRESRLARQHGH